MIRFRIGALLAALATMTFLCAANAQPTVKTYDLRDFFRKPEKSRFVLSPDGKHLAFLARNNGRLNSTGRATA